MLPGLHKVRAKLSGGRVGAYWYAWRGGPCILRAVAASDAALEREVARLAPAAIQQFEALSGPASDGRFLAGLIAAYLDSADFTKNLAPRTQSDYRTALDVVRRDLGEMEVKALEARKARSVLLAWRDRFKDTPKTADARLGALALVLEWARDRGDVGTNPLTDWPRIYQVNRADVIWTEADLARLLPECSPEFALAVLFAAHTGIRLSDLARVPLSAVGEHAITFQTGKSRGRRSVIIPITDPIRDALEQLGAMRRARQADVERRRLEHAKKRVNTPFDAQPAPMTVLFSSLNQPWSSWGLQTAMQRAKKSAGITGLRFHDLRGTAVTNLVRAGLTLEDVATMVGWEKARVEAIAMRYVTSEVVALAIVERMKRSNAG